MIAARVDERVVVCGVDGTPDGRVAALVAVRLAAALDARVVAVNVLTSRQRSPYGSVEPPGDDTLRTATETTDAILEDAVIDLELRDPPSVHVEYGEPRSVLRRVATEHNAELLVVGSRTRTAIAATMRPDISTTLSARCPCPVVIVPDRLDDVGLLAPSRWSRAIICGVDDSPESLAAVQAAARLAAILDARLVLVHVCQVGMKIPGAPTPALADIAALVAAERQGAKQLLRQARQLAREAPRVELETTRGQPAAALNELAHQHGCSLLVVGSRGRGSVRRALLGSTSTALTTTARRPVMVVPSAAVAATLTLER